MYAVGRCAGLGLVNVSAEQMKGGRAVALGEGDGDGCVEGDWLALGVGDGLPPTRPGVRRRGLATNSTPTISAVIRTAATAAIMYGPRASGAWATAERTRSLKPGLGAPLTSSKTLFSSRRK